MVFSSWQPSSRFRETLVQYTRLGAQQWRSVSTTSAINRGLRGSRDDAYANKGGRDRGSSRTDRTSGSASGRSRSQGFVRSDGPRRTRADDFDANPRAFRKPRDDGVPSRRGSGSTAYAARDRRDELPFKDRSMRSRDKSSGFRGQPGFSARAPQQDSLPFGEEQSGRRRLLGFEPQTQSQSAQRGFGSERQGFVRIRKGDLDERPRGFAERRKMAAAEDRTESSGRRESRSSRNRAFDDVSQAMKVMPGQHHQGTADGASAVESSEQKSGAGTGLLRDVKTACKLIRQIQKSEAMGEDTGELINMTLASLRSVNRYVASGKFQDEPGEAVASLFEKKAAAGTFIDIADATSANSSVLFQRGDGKIELAAKRHDSDALHLMASTRPDTTARNKGDSAKISRNDFETDSTRGRDHRSSRSSEPREENDGIPVSVPYTTAASEFLYGANVVSAALKGQRRKLYNLYVHPNIIARESGGSVGRSSNSRYAKPEHMFTALARSANVPFRNEYKAFLLDKMSDGRPHNGVVLEASKLPAPPVLSLGKPDERRSAVPLALAPQSAEEVEVNGGKSTITVATNSWRHPLVVMLDGILDPVNVGSIMRTCHFYGADAVAVAINTCAPLASAVLAKASSGACEAVDILSLPQPANFVRDSANAGWKVYAAVAPESAKPSRDAKPQLTTAAIAASSPLAEHPCILMLGAEGEGLRENLKSKADAFVSIQRGPNNAPDVGVDSMNVGVATGVLLEAFLRRPAGAPAKRDTTTELGF